MKRIERFLGDHLNAKTEREEYEGGMMKTTFPHFNPQPWKMRAELETTTTTTSLKRSLDSSVTDSHTGPVTKARGPTQVFGGGGRSF